jgi:hypothetical protein
MRLKREKNSAEAVMSAKSDENCQVGTKLILAEQWGHWPLVQ